MKQKIVSIILIAGIMLSLASWVSFGGSTISPSLADQVAPAGAVEPAQLPAGSGSPGNYIQFDEPTHNLDQSHGYPATGGHARYGWNILEPDWDGDYRFDEYILPWVQQEVARGKKVAIGFVTYNGRQYGGIDVPSWLWARDPNVRLNNSGYYVLNYLNRTYVEEYKEFVRDFAQWVAANPVVRDNLAWIETGIGLFGENQPTAKNWNDAVDYNYYKLYAPNPDGGNGWSSVHWVNHIYEVNQFYRDAFNNAGMSNMPIVTNIAPTYLADWERIESSNHAVSINVGLKHAGLMADHANALDSYAPIVQYFDGPSQVPICWEVYGPETSFGPGENEWYWTVLAGLQYHPDYWLPTRGVMTYPTHVGPARMAEDYAGVTLQTTPDIWVAMRETFRTGQWDDPIPGDFEFWLYRDDYSQGMTVTETNRSDLSAITNRRGQSVYNPTLGSSKEGWTTRRTSQEDGNPYMWFKIDDGYIYGGPTEATITVTYFDKGTDRWALRYDATSGFKDATPDGSASAWVQKTNSNTWKTATFHVTDGRFQNYMSGGHDFRIDCLNDGNEWIHMVKLTKGTSAVTPTPTRTPTATATPTQTTGSVEIQLYPGSNWVAYGGSTQNVADAMASVAGKYTKVLYMTYEYDAGQGRYMVVW